MKRWILTGVLCTALPVIALADTKSPGSPGAAPVPPAFVGTRLETLKNGMRVLLAPDPLATTVDVAIWYDASPRVERSGQSGVSHLFEHLMFDGSTRFGPQEYRRRIESEGGISGAFTTSDAICFYQTIAPSSVDLVFDLEADRMTGLLLTQPKLDMEKLRAHDEMRERAASPFGRGLQRLYQATFDELQYRRPVLGFESDLARLTLADCRAYYQAHFAPNTALLTVVGNFDANTVLASARKRFEAIPRAAAAAVVRARPEPARTAPRRVSERNDLQIPLLMLGWRGPAASDPDSPALDLLSVILASGASSRLQADLVDNQGPAIVVRGGHEPQRDGALFYVAIGLRPQSDSTAVESAVLAEADKLAREPVSDSELEEARRQGELGLVFPAQTTRGRARLLGTAQMMEGDATHAGRRLELLRAVTADDVKRVAARYLVASARTVVWMPPGGSE